MEFNNVNIELNEEQQRIYFIVGSILNEERVDKKMLLMFALIETLEKKVRDRLLLDEVLANYEKILDNVKKRAKIELFYSLMQSQEERKLLFDEVEGNKIYKISNYPYAELIKIDKEINSLCGSILKGFNSKGSLDIGETVKEI